MLTPFLLLLGGLDEYQLEDSQLLWVLVHVCISLHVHFEYVGKSFVSCANFVLVTSTIFLWWDYMNQNYGWALSTACIVEDLFTSWQSMYCKPMFRCTNGTTVIWALWCSRRCSKMFVKWFDWLHGWGLKFSIRCSHFMDWLDPFGWILTEPTHIYDSAYR